MVLVLNHSNAFKRFKTVVKSTPNDSANSASIDMGLHEVMIPILLLQMFMVR